MEIRVRCRDMEFEIHDARSLPTLLGVNQVLPVAVAVAVAVADLPVSRSGSVRGGNGHGHGHGHGTLVNA